MNIRPTTALRTGYAEKIESKPLVALPDSFRDAETTTAHGEMTDSVLILHGKLQDEEVQRLHAESGAPFHPQKVFEAPAGEVLSHYDEFTKGATLSFLDMTSDNLELVLNEMPSVRVISQSQSQTPTRLVETFLQPIKEDGEFRQRLATELGLENGSVGNVLSALTQHTERSLREDGEISEAGKRYKQLSKQAYDHGIVNLIAGGNQGELARQFEALGAETSPSAFRSILANDYVTVVGAATADGQPASLNSPNAQIDVYALGEKVPVQADGQVFYANGTSVATPLVAGRAAQLIKDNPEISAFQVKNELLHREGYQVVEGTAVQTASGLTLSGDGIVEPWFQETLGPGLITGVDSADVAQFINSPNNVLFGLPGEKDGAFQVVAARHEEGGRALKIDSFYGSEHHVLKARYENGSLVPGSVTEEFYKAKE